MALEPVEGEMSFWIAIPFMVREQACISCLAPIAATKPGGSQNLAVKAYHDKQHGYWLCLACHADMEQHENVRDVVGLKLDPERFEQTTTNKPAIKQGELEL